MNKTTFKFPNPTPNCGDVTFLITWDDYRIIGLEEHDQYQGGPLTKPHNKTWEEVFFDRVVACGGDIDKAVDHLENTIHDNEFGNDCPHCDKRKS